MTETDPKSIFFCVFLANNLPPSPKRLKLDDKPAGEEVPSENQTNSVDIEANIGEFVSLIICLKQKSLKRLDQIF